MLVKMEKGYVGGDELDMLLLAICATLLRMGPGRASIETYKERNLSSEEKLVNLPS